jgi:hypothetical protein
VRNAAPPEEGAQVHGDGGAVEFDGARQGRNGKSRRD